MKKTVKTLDNINRIDSISIEDFEKEHLKKGLPLIIRNVHMSDVSSSYQSQEDFVKAFPDLVIQVQKNYTSDVAKSQSNNQKKGLNQKVKNKIIEVSLKEYCDHVKQTPDTDLLCVEFPTPSQILSHIKVPELCNSFWNTEEIVSFMFIANQGNYAHLHFDGDFRNVLLHQVFGRKRVVMVPTHSMEKILPNMNFSNLLIQNMDEDEKLDLFRYLGAYDCIIEPGETIFFPASIWHYVEYIDTGMSVNFRFARNEFSKKLIDANLVPFYPELHRILTKLDTITDKTKVAELQHTIWHSVEPILRKEYSSFEERHVAVNHLYRHLDQTLFPELNYPLSVIPGYEERTTKTAVERYVSYEEGRLRWREELQLGEPIFGDPLWNMD